MVRTVPLVSVIVPTKNAEARIGKCLTSIQQSSYTNFEIIVVDGKSTDQTSMVARRTGVTVIQGEGRGRASDCMIGIRASRGQIVAFTDDDCIVANHWLEEVVAGFDDDTVGIVGGPDLTRVEGASPVALVAGHIHFAIRRLASNCGADAVIGCNSAYRLTALSAAGGFDDGLAGAEDTPLNTRILALGFKVSLSRRAIVYHERRSTFWKLLRKFWNEGWHMGHVHRSRPGTFKERQKHIFGLIGMVGTVSLLAGLAVIIPPLAWMFVPLAIGYVALQQFIHRYLIRSTGFRSPFFLFVVSSSLCALVYCISFLKEQVFPQGRGLVR